MSSKSELYKGKSAKAGLICSWMSVINMFLLLFFVIFRGYFPLWLGRILGLSEGALVLGSFASGLICVISYYLGRERADKMSL